VATQTQGSAAVWIRMISVAETMKSKTSGGNRKAATMRAGRRSHAANVCRYQFVENEHTLMISPRATSTFIGFFDSNVKSFQEPPALECGGSPPLYYASKRPEVPAPQSASRSQSFF